MKAARIGAAVLLGSALLFFALRGRPGTTVQENMRSPSPAGSAAESAILEGARREGKFVWYTSVPTEAATAYLDAFKSRYPFLDTSEFYRSTSYKVYSRVNIETAAGKHIADAVEISLVPAGIEWKRKGWLMKYDSSHYAAFASETSEPGYWAPLRAFPIMIAYNRLILPAGEAPRRWSDLTHPKWKEAIGVEGLDSGTQHLQYYSLKQALGAAFWEAIAANRPRAYNGAGAMMNGLLSGEIRVALCALSYIVYRYREIEKAPIEAVWPEEGVPVNLAPLAILAGAPHPNAARLFVDWALSAEGQSAMVRLIGAYSLRRDIPPPTGQPAWGSFNALLVNDWDAFTGTLAEFQQAWRGITR